jgi:hypothetical protein
LTALTAPPQKTCDPIFDRGFGAAVKDLSPDF